MKWFKRKRKGGGSTVFTTVILPVGFDPKQVRVIVEGHGGPGSTT